MASATCVDMDFIFTYFREGSVKSLTGVSNSFENISPVEPREFISSDEPMISRENLSPIVFGNAVGLQKSITVTDIPGFLRAKGC
ncbi:hypothetical protein AVEN_165206-1 [Araneus ventricosus]|uniref:Uncharacterized protein n=1 Tax=Araneus ventricosus TaxID=182803 RepID=A0A4Y2B960_ARAVE|nr:hypothetical protein AVEN_165206-1 [Araneus ventricosus]